MDNRILLIDDEPDILSTLEMTLNQEAYSVATATGGEAALALFRKQPFDLVITDMRMPGIDGAEVIRRVKALDPDVEVIMLTGYATLENAVTVLRNAGAFDYLTKPLEDIDDLLMVVEKALEKRRLTLENRALLKSLKEKEAELTRQNQVLRESERKYRELADTLPVNLFKTDVKGTLTFLNPFALERFQYTREDLTKGLHVMDVLDEKQWEKTQKDARKRIDEKSFEAIESVAKRKDGTTFPVLVSIHPIFRENRFSGLRGFALDITDRKQRLEEMIRMAKLESLGTLAGGIAHDFNNLLSIILGNIELASWDMAPEKPSAKALELAIEGCLSAKELTAQFITFSKGGAPQMRKTDIGMLLRNMATLSRSGSNVNCVYSIPKELPFVELDAQQMGQAIQNLIQNAIESMPEGGTVHVFAEDLTLMGKEQRPIPGIPEGRYVKLEFQDEGHGIPEEDKSKVFDPYFSTKARGAQKGMGMGLTTALSIVKKHDGFMFLESNAVSGTTVSIYLPTANHDGKAVEAGQEGPVLGKEGPSKGLKVLVMDDERMLRALVEKMLQRLGYRAETAGNGTEAVEIYKKALDAAEPFDLVLLDLTVKGGPGGKEAIRELLKLDPGVRAVVCSGYVDDPAMSNWKDYGFRASLAKPFLKESLADAVRKALGRDIQSWNKTEGRQE